MHSTGAATSVHHLAATPNSQSPVPNSFASQDFRSGAGHAGPSIYGRADRENYQSPSRKSRISEISHTEPAVFARLISLNEAIQPSSSEIAMRALLLEARRPLSIELSPEVLASLSVFKGPDGGNRQPCSGGSTATDAAATILSQNTEADCCTTICSCTIQ